MLTKFTQNEITLNKREEYAINLRRTKTKEILR